MPNHVSQRMTLVGPHAAVQKFRTAHFIHGHPAGLQGEIDTFEKKTVDMAALQARVDAGETLSEDEQRELNWWNNWGAGYHKRQAEEAKESLAKIEAGEPGTMFSLDSFSPVAPFIFQGGLTLEDEKRTGRRNWYVDNRRRFGTKWDAYSCVVREEVTDLGDGNSKFVFYYETAWSQPSPILDLIAQAYPDLHVTLEYLDEGWCFWGVRYSYGYEVVDNEHTEYKGDVSAFKELMWLERNIGGWDDERFAEFLKDLDDDERNFVPEELRDPALLGTEKPGTLLLGYQTH
ncbi:Uncharacterised protein [Ectopseudomonas mendocina]|uniref:YubB ferredoxin-like domain-containing protein n=1 Tax=Ectopseudomonas mendocina TaxID=300 RepID=A0A379PM90_ECTME|nr:hypothetical protein [Pseudomonas mendocina]SUE95887.1 Uncharacterised protein [Pseudomonas mendocina]